MKFYVNYKVRQMDSSYTKLIINKLHETQNLCLDTYLEIDKLRTKELLPGGIAELDCENFSNGIQNLVSVIDEFVHGKDKALSVLVLGKIQSGKTSHMLGTLAWAVDTKIALATVFTGVTADLNNQTITRLRNTLGAQDPSCIKVLVVPTSHIGKEYEDLRSTLDEFIFARISRNSSAEFLALPVLATLKTVQRINTLNILHEELSLKYGSDLISLIIDDEADQASQNSGSLKGKTTKIYEAISSVRKTLVRNIYLAYTATPQAVLLTERFGKLRPDLCVVVPPRQNYFGLENLISPDYERNLIQIDDWIGSSESLSHIPHSLKNAIHDYFWLSAVKIHRPEVFYSESGLQPSAMDQFLKSTQMLIHESSKTRLHSSMYRVVIAELKSYKNDLVNYGSGLMTPTEKSGFYESLCNSWSIFRKRLKQDLARMLPEFPQEEFIEILLDVVSDTQVIVVNAAKSRPNSEVGFPSDADEWQRHKSWICIGGDILGRGLTIPQLLTTYFLRSAKVPNFDTVSQQMRFCGYRRGYESFTSVWAEEATLLSFRYMREIEAVVWNRAKRWDDERIRINLEIPKVFYASPIATHMEPTRKSVRDPYLIDNRIKGEIVFSSRKIMAPLAFRNNFSLVRQWFAKHSNDAKLIPDWVLLEDFTNADINSLLSEWTAEMAEKSSIVGAMELFAADMDSLGLANVPRAMFISRDVLEFPQLRDQSDLESLVRRTKFFRTVSNANETLHLSAWVDSVFSGATNTPFDPMMVTHIGGTIRKLKSQLQFDSTVFVIQFMRGVQGRGADAETVSLGLTLTILAPTNYEVRMIGHS